MVKKTILKIIKLYQKTLSLDHGWFRNRFPAGYCKFDPSCSMYTYQAVEKYGAVQGLRKGFFRVLRCNPWNPGGIDKP